MTKAELEREIKYHIDRCKTQISTNHSSATEQGVYGALSTALLAMATLKGGQPDEMR